LQGTPEEHGMANSTGVRLHAVSPRRLSAEIVEQIQQLIFNHELEVGDALPAERELAAQLHVSRNVLREAISTLVQKGLLEVRPGSGTYVARPSSEFLQDSLDVFVRANNAALLELVEARRPIEIEIAGLAAQRATATDTHAVAHWLAEMEAARGDHEAYIAADIQFHEALAQAAKNRILQSLLVSIRGAIGTNIRVLAQRHPVAVDEAMGCHRRIADAIQRQSPRDARAAMQQHLDGLRRRVQELEKMSPTNG